MNSTKANNVICFIINRWAKVIVMTRIWAKLNLAV